MAIINSIITDPTNFNDIDFLIANFLDLSAVTVYTGGINSIRRCVIGL